MKVSKLYGINSVAVADWSKAWPNSKNPEIVIPSTRAVGIEVEVENNTMRKRTYSGVWQNHADGSLRNNGTEYVTHPIPANVAPYALQELLVESLDDNSCCFSPRTSIHVHVDFSKEDDTSAMYATLMYTLFEKMLFRFTGRGRVKNIYCVPIIDTEQLAGKVRSAFSTRYAHSGWSKYSAMNMLPLSQYGTLEFRHMHGTFDMAKVCIWIRMLTNLCDYVCTTPSVNLEGTINNLGPDFDFLRLATDIFQGDVDLLKYQGYDDVEQAVGKIATAYINTNIAANIAELRDAKAPIFTQGK